MATSKWREWQPGQNILKGATQEPSKPSKPGSDSFVGSYPGLSEIFSPESPGQDAIDAAIALLKSVEARLWTDNDCRLYIGIWECVDSVGVRQAVAVAFPQAKLLHLERPEVPLRLKMMSRRVARIGDARWKVWS